MPQPIASPTITMTAAEARQLILTHQGLWPPRQLENPDDILAFIRRVGCIQFDPIQITLRNADLVLQSRVNQYHPGILENLLYTERRLWDGWDKMAAIYPVEDWPFFSRQRQAMEKSFDIGQNEAMQAAPFILEQLKERGPLSSLELETTGSIPWMWGNFVRLERACLEALFARGEIAIHRRVSARRYFDLVERLLPAEILTTPDPNPCLENYQDWHVHRRIGGIGLVRPGGADSWLGIRETKSPERKQTLLRLVDQGKITPIAIEGIKNEVFFAQADTLADQPAENPAVEPRAALIAPLDNLIWDRELVRMIFNFDYTWEVYKPAEKRQYGYYVLPILYGDQFAARCELSLDRKNFILQVKGWWWEPNIQPDGRMITAIQDCIDAFKNACGARIVQAVPGLENGFPL